MSDDDVIEYIREYFIYNQYDGEFHRKDRRNSSGSFDKDGYLIIKIKKKQFKAHRLVWAFHYGKFPNGEIDHINRIRNDNRIENLRESTRIMNILNTTKKANKDTGVVGVYIDNTRGLKKKFTTKLGTKTYRFMTLDEAIEKRREHYEHLPKITKM